MKQQELFLNNLLDFSNLQSKRTQYQPTIIQSSQDHKKHMLSMQKNKPSNVQSMSNQNNRSSEPIPAINSTQATNNQKLLKTFNTLRQKLNLTNRQNISLKQEQQVLVQQIQQYQDKQKHYVGQIQNINKKRNAMEQQLNQYKCRLNSLKQNMAKNQQKADEYENLKLTCLKLSQDNKKLKQQSIIAMQISLQDKISLQQQLQTLRLKQIQNCKNTEDIENQLYQKNKSYIKLQNQFKKLKLIYDEELYSKKVNTQSTLLARQNQQLKLKVDELESKIKKQKNKKYELESKLLELQEKVRLYGTKTDIYQGQLQCISKKMKKVQKDQQYTKKEADQAINEKLSWQQKFYNCTIICQELISRVKRQLKGDVFELSKTCQFRLNKLKNDQRLDLKDKLGRDKSSLIKPYSVKQRSSQKRLRSQTLKHKNNQQQQNEQDLKKYFNSSSNKNNILNSHNIKLQNSPVQSDLYTKTVVKQSDVLKQKNENNLQDVKRKLLFNDLTTPSKIVQQKKNLCQSNNLGERQGNQTLNNMNLESKIRKQRQLMERKLREKMLYHKIQDATSSPIKHQLREQYFNIANLDMN